MRRLGWGEAASVAGGQVLTQVPTLAWTWSGAGAGKFPGACPWPRAEWNPPPAGTTTTLHSRTLSANPDLAQ